jgi:hypothetical protein
LTGTLEKMSRATASFLTMLTLLAALALAGGVSANAAAQPCWKQVLNDWHDDGRIDGVYPASCYQEALKHVPEDVLAYSSFPDDVKRARQEMLRVRRLQGLEKTAGDSRETPNSRRIQEREPQTEAGSRDEGPIDSALNRLGSKDADSLPLPLLVLAGLAAALMVAGGAGLAHRKLQARRPK